MKSYLRQSIRLACIALIMLGAFALARGQAASNQATSGQVTGNSGRLMIDDLDRLTSKAAESVNVSLDERLLRIVPKAFSEKDPDERKIKEIIAGLKGVYVRVFEFDAVGAYSDGDVNPIRQQLRAPGWSRIVEVRSRKEDQQVEVYIMNNGDKVDGLAVLAFEPKQLVIVNIVGTIDLEKLSKLEGEFGVPVLEIERDPKPRRK
ncbi:MAG: DUF4252 domain-containing protein [Pyrinomonadaceae bacterium]|nr:DUF4252 domain-containing protein [Pyrinomonadaceae bacterium]